MACNQEHANVNNMPAPFRLEGPYRKIVPDSSFLKKIIKLGLGNFVRDATNLVGHADIFTTWCIDHAMMHHLTGMTLPPRKHLTCVDRETCPTEVECLANLIGGVNPDNLVIATQNHTHQFNNCARLPILTYNASNVLVYCPPSLVQLSFARRTEEQRQKEVSEEAAVMYRKVRSSKKIKRKARV